MWKSKVAYRYIALLATAYKPNDSHHKPSTHGVFASLVIPSIPYTCIHYTYVYYLLNVPKSIEGMYANGTDNWWKN